MLAATLLIGMSLAADGRPSQAPRPPQFPPPGVVLIAAPPACGLSGCTCGCRSGEVCRCAAPAAVAVPAAPVFYPRPVYQPVYRPAFQPMTFGGFSGGGGGC